MHVLQCSPPPTLAKFTKGSLLIRTYILMPCLVREGNSYSLWYTSYYVVCICGISILLRWLTWSNVTAKSLQLFELICVQISRRDKRQTWQAKHITCLQWNNTVSLYFEVCRGNHLTSKWSPWNLEHKVFLVIQRLGETIFRGFLIKQFY